MAEPPTKRARLSSYTEDEKLWLKDGNIILVSAQPNRKGFKVHRSFLALNAEFFSDLDNFARPDASGAQELELTDSTEDLTHFLYSLYITGYFTPGETKMPFSGLASILRLANKYLCPRLRTNVVRHLRFIYPCTSKRPDTLRMAHPLVPDSDHHNHPLLAIRMARESNVVDDLADFLPTAFYLACQIPARVYVKLEPALSREDDARIVCARSSLGAAAVSLAHQWVRSMSYDDCSHEVCREGRLGIVQDMYAEAATALSLFVNEMPHVKHARKVLVFYGRPPHDYDPDEDRLICGECAETWRTKDIFHYNDVWEKLPSYFDLPPWPRLQA